MNATQTELETYRRALALAKRIRPWVQDGVYAQRGWKIYYAIDTDVIHLYLRSGHLPPNYCDIFGNDDATASLLARLLGDFLFLSPSIKHSFLLFEPHQAEFYRVLHAIAREVSQASSVTHPQFQHLCEIFERFQKDGDKQALLESLEANAGALVMLYDKNRGAKAMLDRFSMLPPDKLVSMERFSDDAIARLPIPDERESPDRQYFQSRIRFWEDRLRACRAASSPDQPVHALLADAEVLASLEFVNARLESEKKRVMLITASSYIYTATRPFTPKDGNPEARSFDALYLRHPQAFLAHSDFFRTSDSNQGQPGASEFEVAEWLGILFPKALRDSARRQAEDHRQVQELGDKGTNPSEFFASFIKASQPSLPDLPTEWASQVRKTALSRYGGVLFEQNRSGATDLGKVVSEMIARNDWSLQAFQSLLSSSAAESLSQMYSHAVWVGLWSNQGVVLEDSRGVPKLRFDKPFVAIVEYYEKVLQLQARSSKLSENDIDALTKANRALREIDPSLYHMHVVHALAFATKGRWEAAITLCRMAMTIADSLPDNLHEYRRGREAAYLAAIATRRAAKYLGDLDHARRYLEEAIRRENAGALPDVRFNSETIALRSREILFRFYCLDEMTAAGRIFPMLRELKEVLEETDAPQNEDVRSWVVRQCCTNFFNLLFIHVKIGAPTPASLALLMLQRFSALLKNENEKFDPHAQVVFLVANVLLELVPPTEENAYVEGIVKRIDNMRMIRPYDSGRKDLMKDLLRANGHSSRGLLP